MYIDTANLEEIKLSLETGLIKGVTTNPSILKKEERPREEQIKDIYKLGVDELFVQLVGDNAEEMFEDYLKIKDIEEKLNKKIMLKVPLILEGIKAIKKIKEIDKSRKILGTAIYSADQGIMGAISGCDYLAPYVNRMKNNSINPIDEILKMRTFIDARGLDTKILAASFKNTEQITESLINGSHTCTISYDLLVQMLDKDLALNAVTVFNRDAKMI